MWLARVDALHIYPLKSARGQSLPASVVDAAGLRYDRRWMLVDHRGRFITQRTHPKLATLPALASPDALELGPAMRLPRLRVSVPQPGMSRLTVEVWSHRGDADDGGDVAAQWCSDFLGESVRLVHAGPALQRVADATWTANLDAPVGFADGYPILVCNQASLDDLSQRAGRPLSMGAFRPNIVLTGLPAWAEDGIECVEVAGLALRLCKPCVRCVIPSIDQQTGMPATDPTPALKQFRWNRALRGVTFGVNACVQGGAGSALRVGDEARCLPASGNDAGGTQRGDVGRSES